MRMPLASVSQALAALVVLAVGMAVYLLDRQPDDVYLMAPWMASSEGSGLSFGALGLFLPTFTHVYCFILLTAACVAPTRVQAIWISVLWFVVDSLFELAQMDAIAGAIANHLPTWFESVPLLNNTAAYFLAGTCDVIDLASIAMGAVAAYLTIVITQEKTWRNN
jgi:hypothetical protein